MKFLKGYFYFNVFLLVGLVVLAIYFRPQLNTYAKDFILNKYAETGLGPLQIEKLTVQYTWPPKVHLENVKAEIPSVPFSIQVPFVEVTVHPQFKSLTEIEELAVEVRLERMKYSITILPTSAADQVNAPQAAQAEGTGSPSAQGMRVNVQLSGQDGQFELKQMQMIEGKLAAVTMARTSQESFKIELNDALNPDKKIKIQYQNVVQLPTVLGEKSVPLKIQTQDLHLTASRLSTPDMSVNVAGVGLLAQGSMDLATQDMAWSVKVDLPQIEKLPIPPDFLPAGQWSGGIIGQIEIKRQGGAPISISGDVRSENLKGDISLRQKDLTVQGPISPVLNFAFKYDGALTLPRIDVVADATKLRIDYKDFFVKPVGVPLNLNAKAQGDGPLLNFDNLEVRLDQLLFTAKGEINIQKSTNANLIMRIAPVSLESLAPYILPLKKSPVLGTFEMRSQVSGSNISIQNLDFLSRIGQISVSGLIEDYLKPRLKLNVSLTNVKLKEMSQLSETLKPLNLDGTLNSQLAIMGDVDPEFTIEKSALTLKGNVVANLNKYRFVPVAVAAAPTTPQPPTPQESWEQFQKRMASLPEPTGLLPNWPILMNSELTMRVSLKEFQYGDQLSAQGLSFAGSYAKSRFVGQAKIDEIFSGGMNWPHLEVQNLMSRPLIIAEGSVQNMQILELVKFFSPQNIKWVESGVLSAQVAVKTPPPQTKNWLLNLTANGQSQAKQLHTKENAIDQMMGEKLAQFAKDKQILSKKGVPFIADVETSFVLQEGRAEVKRFHFLTVDQNEFEAQGHARVDLMADLKGTLHLATVDIQGDIKAANSDARGRFVLPVEFSGSLLNPSYTVAASTLQAIAKKTLSYEGQKVKQALKDRLKDKKTQEQLKDALKKIF